LGFIRPVVRLLFQHTRPTRNSKNNLVRNATRCFDIEKSGTWLSHRGDLQLSLQRESVPRRDFGIYVATLAAHGSDTVQKISYKLDLNSLPQLRSHRENGVNGRSE